MPKDALLTSLIEDTSNDVILPEDVNSRNSNEIKIEGLTPPELKKEFDLDFEDIFSAAVVDDEEILSKEGNNKTEIDSILEEHSYSKKLFRGLGKNIKVLYLT